MTPSIVVLVALTVVVAALAAYRWFVAQHEDDFLHLSDPTGEIVTNQRQTEHTLSQVDRIGIALTIATAVYAVALLVVYIYQGLQRPI
jgi:hypothetical protein